MTIRWPEPDAAAVPQHTLTQPEVTVHRQPVVRPDRSVRGYAISVVVRAPSAPALSREDLDLLVHAEYEQLDLAALSGPKVTFVRATIAMLMNNWPLPATAGGIVLEIPPEFADQPDAGGHLTRLRSAGVGLALADYVPGGSQDALLPLVDFAKVNLGRGGTSAAAAIEHAHRASVPVIAERVDREARRRFCATYGVELLQGPLFERDAPLTERTFTPGELQCLELMVILGGDEVDHDDVLRIIGSDPELLIRVLHLANSSAFSLKSRVDSVRYAVILLGPRQLGALVAASLIDAGTDTLSGLWFVLTRAAACRTLAKDDAAYTVGLLSAVASQLRIAPVDLIRRSGVSDDVGNAVLNLSGPFGPVLAAVLAHEENDIAGVEATGLAQFDVAHAYLDAVAGALGTVTSLSDLDGRGTGRGSPLAAANGPALAP